MVLRAVGNAARHGVWVRVQLPVPALHITRAGYARQGILRGYMAWGWMG